MIEKSPYDDIMNRYPDPDINDPYDYANGGLASFANGGKTKKKKLNEDLSEEELKQIYEEKVMELAGEKAPPGLIFDTEKGQGVMSLFFGPQIRKDKYPGVNIKDPRIGLYYSSNYENETAPRFDFSIGPKGGSLGFTKRFADGGLTKIGKPTQQVDVSTNPIARALEMAGFTGEEIMRIMRERGYVDSGSAGGGFTDYLSNPIYQNFLNSPFVDKRAVGSAVITPVTLPTGEILNLPNAATAEQFRRYLSSTPAGGAPVTIPKPVTEPLTPETGLPVTIPKPVTEPLTPATGLPVTIPKPVTEPLTPATGLPVTTMPVTQPTAEAPIISLERFIDEIKFQAEADAAARSNTSFTKTFSDYLPTQTMTTPTLNTNIEQNLISNNLSRLFPENNFYDSLRTNPITSNMQNIYNTSLDRRPISSAFSPTSILGSLESRMGEFQPFANRLNLSQQEAAARVTPRIFGRNGGLADYVDGGLASFANGGLTETVSPVRGPMSQGVESLFRRRYN
jgi:hypothetical protein